MNTPLRMELHDPIVEESSITGGYVVTVYVMLYNEYGERAAGRIHFPYPNLHSAQRLQEEIKEGGLRL